MLKSDHREEDNAVVAAECSSRQRLTSAGVCYTHAPIAVWSITRTANQRPCKCIAESDYAVNAGDLNTCLARVQLSARVQR